MHALLEPDRAHKLIKAAKTPIPFAFVAGKTPAEGALAVDKTKTGRALFDLCKGETGLKKGAYGTVVAEGTAAVFTCEKDDVANLERALLAYFKAHRITLKPELATPDPEEGDEPLESQSEEDESPPAKAEQRPDAKDEDAAETERRTPIQDDADEDIPEGRVFEPEVIVALIRKANTKPKSFAFGLAGQTSLLAMHPRMAPKRLAAKVKQEGAKRGAWGSVGRDGAVAIFTCEKDPFPGLRRGLKRWFKQHGLSLKLRVHGPEGEYDDPEDVDLDEAAETEATTGGGVDDGGLAELRQRRAALVAPLKAVAEARPDLAADIRATYGACGEALKAGDAARAEALLATLDALAATPADDPDDFAVGTPDPDVLPDWFDRARFETARARWLTAMEQAETQVATLIAALRQTADDELHTIADRHLPTVLGGGKTPVTAALLDVGLASGGSVGVAAGRALGVLAAFRTHLASDPRIPACENNPLGIRVALRGTLLPALDDLESVLKAA